MCPHSPDLRARSFPVTTNKKPATIPASIDGTLELLKSGDYHGIATHDEKMIEATISFAKAENISASAFEFQMLYGVRRDLQRELVKRGYGMRVYIPFGAEWYPYLMRRLAERPANALFIARNLFRA